MPSHGYAMRASGEGRGADLQGDRRVAHEPRTTEYSLASAASGAELDEPG